MCKFSMMIALGFPFLGLFFFPPLAHSQSDFSVAVERISKSVVVIKGNNSLGSGFIVSRDGKIATNLHVIQNMTQAVVQLKSGQTFPTFMVVGFDVGRDLAIIKVDGSNLPAVNLGDSESVRVGEPIAVVGSPRGLSGSVTTGVLSAKRQVEGQQILQIDAAVNPGNSGGPMIRLDGTVIGVVVARLIGAENLNFAVPVNSLRDLLNSPSEPITLAQLRTSFAVQNKPPTGWREIEIPAGHFRVLFPAPPRTTRRNIKTDIGNVASTRYTVSDAAGVTYDVLFNDYPRDGLAKAPHQKLLDSARDGLIYQSKGRLIGEKPITLDGYPGRDQEILGPDGTHYRVRLVWADTRLYQLMAVTPGKPRPESSVFFDSFRITGRR